MVPHSLVLSCVMLAMTLAMTVGHDSHRFASHPVLIYYYEIILH